MICATEGRLFPRLGWGSGVASSDCDFGRLVLLGAVFGGDTESRCGDAGPGVDRTAEHGAVVVLPREPTKPKLLPVLPNKSLEPPDEPNSVQLGERSGVAGGLTPLLAPHALTDPPDTAFAFTTIRPCSVSTKTAAAGPAA